MAIARKNMTKKSKSATASKTTTRKKAAVKSPRAKLAAKPKSLRGRKAKTAFVAAAPVKRAYKRKNTTATTATR